MAIFSIESSFIRRLYYKIEDLFKSPVKLPPDSERLEVELPPESEAVSVEMALNSRCNSDYDENPNKFHWGMFDRRKKLIGFRSPAMHHNLEWLHDLNIEYDASTFDTDPFEPQSDGVGTVFPFWVRGNSDTDGYVELPYTLVQDFTLFVLMKEETVDIWKEKLDWIVEKGGMALMNTHPDYMNFDGEKLGLEEYPAAYYVEFLEYTKSKYEGHYWHPLPKDMAQFWSKNIK